MKKILLLPLLDSLPSGHHQVANTIASYVNNRSNDIECKKIDLLNSWNPLIETLITKTYLSWIQRFPASYAWIYKKLAYQPEKKRTYKHYDMLFLKNMKGIIDKERPDLIICTHAFPSYLVNQLKKSGECKVPTLNIYTDFFINDVWGVDMIDYHFVPNKNMKSSLIKKNHIPKANIYVTGIPIDESFTRESNFQKSTKKLNIIISGGSAGLGDITNLLKHSRKDQRINYYILCGNNKQLFNQISNLKQNNIHPLPYLSSREKMNELYNLADAMITKPGGVTVSEGLNKGVPIFIHSTLPGQEEINLNQLSEQGLVFKMNNDVDLIRQVLMTLNNEAKMKRYQRARKDYFMTFDLSPPLDIYLLIESILGTRRKDLTNYFNSTN